jgi:excisionase family DNA binding protein
MTRIFTSEELAAFLKITTKTLAIWVKKGLIPGRKIENRWLFREDEVLEAISSKTAVPTEPATETNHAAA